MDIVFLDANVLFSAAYKHDANFLKLWRLKDVHLVSSLYAAGEAERNLKKQEQRDRLQKLLASVEFVPLVAANAFYLRESISRKKTLQYCSPRLPLTRRTSLPEM